MLGARVYILILRAELRKGETALLRVQWRRKAAHQIKGMNKEKGTRDHDRLEFPRHWRSIETDGIADLIDATYR